jgi:hypothetical protein
MSRAGKIARRTILIGSTAGAGGVGVVRILNLAFGATFMFASYLIYSLASGLGLPAVPAWLLAVVATSLVGVILYAVFIYPLRGNLGPVLIVTAGIAIFLQEVAVLLFSTEPRYVPTVLPGSVSILGARVTHQQLLLDPRSGNIEPPAFRCPAGPLADLMGVFNGRPLYDPRKLTMPTLLLRGSDACLSRSERSTFLQLLNKMITNSAKWAKPY